MNANGPAKPVPLTENLAAARAGARAASARPAR